MNADPLITEVARDVLGGTDPDSPAGEPHPVWRTAVELGWPQVGVAEQHGGSGGSTADLAALVAATAAAGVKVPLAETALSRWVLESSWPAEAGAAPVITAEVTGAPEVLDRVPWARHASHLLLVRDGGPAQLLDLRDPGVEVEPGANLAGEPRDRVRVSARAASTPVRLGRDPRAVRSRAALLNAAGLLGAARGAQELTREHVTTREQFDRPLVALKPVAGGLAEMTARLVAAEAAVDRAARLADEDDAQRAAAAAASAKVVAADTATEVARTAHQLHGAIGVTREHALHHVTRALLAWRDECGAQRDWAAELGRRAAAGGEESVWRLLTG